MGILPKLNILASINDISMGFTIPLSDKRDQYWKPDFPDNLKKYKTKTIPKNSILFKSKYDFKNKIWRYENFLLSYLVLEIILWFKQDAVLRKYASRKITTLLWTTWNNSVLQAKMPVLLQSGKSLEMLQIL